MNDETERDEREDRRSDEATDGGLVGIEADDSDGDTDLDVEIRELRGELEELNDRHLRLAAEFDNYRRRIERDRQALVARLQIDLISSLLDVVDDLERVMQSDEDTTATAVVDGVRLVEKKFRSILGSAGLEPIDAEGQVFDPETMDAMMTVPTDDPARDGHVADVFQRGYRFGDVLVRPARVRVLSYEGPAEGSE